MTRGVLLRRIFLPRSFRGVIAPKQSRKGEWDCYAESTVSGGDILRLRLRMTQAKGSKAKAMTDDKAQITNEIQMSKSKGQMKSK
jgi:hypothetical protein